MRRVPDPDGPVHRRSRDQSQSHPVVAASTRRTTGSAAETRRGKAGAGSVLPPSFPATGRASGRGASRLTANAAGVSPPPQPCDIW